MPKYIHTIACALCLALAALMAGCTAEPAFDQLPIGRLTVERRVPIEQAEGAPACVVSMSIDSVAGTDSVAGAINSELCEHLFRTTDMGLQEAAEAFANRYTSDYVSYLTPFYNADRGNKGRRTWYEYSYKMDTRVEQGRQGYVAYVATHEFSEGGAHSVMLRMAINFSANTGRTITLHDILVPGYEPRLKAMLLKALQQNVGAKTLDELHDKGYLQDMDMFVTDNFTINADGLTFIYNPYEIAPYGNGSTDIHVDYDTLAELLKHKDNGTHH